MFPFDGVAIASPGPFSMLLATPCVILADLAGVFVWRNGRRRAAARHCLLAGRRDIFLLTSDASAGAELPG